MNKNSGASQDSHKTFLLLSEIEKEEKLSQRELANRLGIALGLVNSYMKNLVTKGFVRVKAFPRNRYGYLLTPKGFAEKSRLAYQHLSYFTSLYTTTRQGYLELFHALTEAGVEEVVFCGVDEVAEIAYLSLQETGLLLTAVVEDEHNSDRDLFGVPVVSLSADLNDLVGELVITSLKRAPYLRKKVAEVGWKRELYSPPDLAGDGQ